MRRVYLDNAASTPLLPSVKAAMISAMEKYGNPSSLHLEGRVARKVLIDAKVEVAKLIGAKPKEIIFTSGGTESNNMVINAYWGRRVAISAIEHPSVSEPFLRIAGKKMRHGNVLPVDKNGKVIIDNLLDIMTDRKPRRRPVLVSVMLANNEIGTIQDIASIAEIVHKNGALLHVDASQAAGIIPINVNKLGIDYLTLTAHKIGGPKGVGALYIRESSPMKPSIVGGFQQDNLRGGTENIVDIAGFSAAAKNARTTYSNFYAKAESLKRRLLDGIVNNIPEVVVNGDKKNSLPNILNVSFAGAEGESILLMLDRVGISVSTGSACATFNTKPSHVLTATSVDPELAHNSIRFSLGQITTIKDIDYVIEKLPPIIEKLRKMSSIKTAYPARSTTSNVAGSRKGTKK